MKRILTIVLIVLLVVAGMAVIFWLYVSPPKTAESNPAQDEGTTITDENVTTNKIAIFCEEEGETYNPLLIGYWAEENGWHKVYTEEYSGNGYYWGKEWDESEDVQEKDLVDYGNGWFEWKMEDNQLIELATTDMNGVRIPVEYKIQLTENQLQLTTVSDRKQVIFCRQ